jgi:hypothetical protein
MISTTTSVIVASTLLSTMGLVAACSNSNANPAPVYQVGNEGGADGTTGTTDGGTDGTAPSGDAAPDAPQSEPDGDLQDGEVVPDAPQDALTCTTDAGCWTCLPTTTSQFLNQCTTSQCSPFVNTQRLPDYDGSLPPLQ